MSTIVEAMAHYIEPNPRDSRLPRGIEQFLAHAGLIGEYYDQQMKGGFDPFERLYTHVKRIVSQVVFAKAENRYVDKITGVRYTAQALTQSMRQGYDGEKASGPQLFTRHGGVTVDGEGYLPGHPRFVRFCYSGEGRIFSMLNSYVPPKLPRPVEDKAAWDAWTGYLDYLCNGDAATVEQILDWMAQLVRVREVIQTVCWPAVVFSGCTVPDKFLLQAVLTELVGKGNCLTGSSKMLRSKSLSNEIYGSQVIVLDEPDVSLLTAVESLREEPTLRFTVNKRTFETPNIASWVILTGNREGLGIYGRQALDIETKRSKQVRDSAFYEDLKRVLLPKSGGSLKGVLFGLWNRPL